MLPCCICLLSGVVEAVCLYHLGGERFEEEYLVVVQVKVLRLMDFAFGNFVGHYSSHDRAKMTHTKHQFDSLRWHDFVQVAGRVGNGSLITLSRARMYCYIEALLMRGRATASCPGIPETGLCLLGMHVAVVGPNRQNAANLVSKPCSRAR